MRSLPRMSMPVLLISFVAFLLPAVAHAQPELLTGWTYRCEAKPLEERWADPEFSKLTDGDKAPGNSAIFGGGAVTVDVTLGAPARLTRIVANVHRHNNNYKLSKVTVQAHQAGQYMLAGQNTNGFWGPTKETSFALEIPLDTVAERLRITFHAASIVSIQEIEIFGTPQEASAAGEYSLPVEDSPGARVVKVDADGDSAEEIVLENPHVRLIFEQEGGVCRSMLLKASGSELVGGSGRYGLLRDQLWDPKYMFADRFYFTDTGADEAGAWVQLRTQGAGGMLSFTQITKRISLTADSPVVKVHYSLLNDPNSQTDYKYGLWSHHFLGVEGQDATYFFPTTDGVVEQRFEAGKAFESWHYNPSRGWTAYVADSGVGLAAVLDYKYLNCFYMWAGAGTAIPTLEWRYNRMPVKAGRSFETDIALIPISGLKRVDGAFDQFVGALHVDSAAAAGHTQVKLSYQDLGSPAVGFELYHRALPDGEWVLDNEPRPGAARGEVGHLLELLPGAYVVKCSVLRNGKVVGELERAVSVGDVKLAYTMAPQEERVGETGPADVKTQPGHELSTQVETPHFKWAKPYYRGPVKALVLCDDRYSREVIELWQRLEMQFEYVKFYTTLNREWLYHGDRSILTLEAAQRRLTEKLKQDYDVIILSGLKWDHHFTEAIRQTLAQKVTAGAGLLYIEPDGLSEEDELSGVCGLPDGASRSLGWWGHWEQTAEHYLTSGLPWETLPQTRRMPFTAPPRGEVLAQIVGRDEQPLVVAGALGEGRVVTLTYDTLTHVPSYRGYSALTPAISYRGNYNRPEEMKQVTWQYWEHWWALLTRCAVWAAAKDSGLRIEGLALEESGENLTGRIVGQIPAGLKVDVIFRDRFSAQFAHSESNIAQDGRLTVAMPGHVRSGKCFADIVLRDPNGASVAWASYAFDGPEAPGFKAVAVENRTITDTKALWTEDQPWKQVFSSNVPFRLTCEVDTVLPHTEPVTVSARLVDCHGRLLFKDAQQVTQGSATLTFEATPPVLYNIGYRWDVELRSGDSVRDTAHAELIALPPREWDRFTLTSWGGQHLWRCQYLFDYLRPRTEALGLDIAFNGENELGTGKVWWDYWQNIGHSFLGILSNLGRGVPDFMDRDYAKKSGEYAKTKDKQWLVRTPSLRDPEYLAQTVEGITNNKMPSVAQYGGAYDYCMGDEMSLTHYTRYFDFDFGEHSLAAFRVWLKERYASVEELNQAWETAFGSWDAVMPMTLDEVKDRPNAAPWAQFRDFMNDTLADYYRLVQDTIRQVDPEAKCGLSGTQEPKPGNGMDWWQNSQAFSYYHSYNTGWSDEMRRSFQPYTGVMCTPYRCGYWQAGQALEYQNFWCLLHDTKGISAWTTPLFFYGDFTYSEAGQDTQANILELKAGLWDTIRDAKRQHDGIAIHYSHPSINAALLMDKDQEIVKVRDAWVKLIEDMGLQYNFVSYAQIEEGILQSEDEGYKLLILPESIALSDAEVANIRRFVAEGGSIVGDLCIGLMDDKCRRQATGRLDDVFGIRRGGDGPVLPPGVQVLNVKDTINLPVGETMVQATEATPRAKAVDADIPAVMVNRYQQGVAAYLNINMAEFETERRFATVTERVLRETLAKVFADCSIRPPYPVAYQSGRMSHVEVVRYGAGPVEYLGLLRDRSDAEAEVATVALSKAFHVYDVRAGSYLGRHDTITAPMLPGDCRVYCLASERLGAVSVQTPGPRADGSVPYTLSLDAALPGERQGVRVTVLGPDGAPVADYARNYMISDRPVEGSLQLALSDRQGRWTIRAQPLCSGEEGAAQAAFELAR